MTLACPRHKALQLLPRGGDVAPALTLDKRINGVALPLDQQALTGIRSVYGRTLRSSGAILIAENRRP